MTVHAEAQNTLGLSNLTMDQPQLHHGNSPEILSFNDPSVANASPKITLLNTEFGYVLDFTGNAPAASFSPMKENLPHSTSSSNHFKLLSYDSFFSTPCGPINNLPTSYGSFWSSQIFKLALHATLSPITISASLDPSHSSLFGSSGVLSTSPVSSTSSFHHTSTLFLDSDTPFSISSNPQFITDVQMGSLDPAIMSPHTK